MLHRSRRFRTNLPNWEDTLQLRILSESVLLDLIEDVKITLQINIRSEPSTRKRDYTAMPTARRSIPGLIALIR